MSRVVRYIAAVAVIAASVSGCGSKGTSPTPAPDLSGLATSSAAKGSGTATVNVAGTKTAFRVTCTASGRATQAVGNEGTNAVTLTVRGTPVSAVLVTHGKDGSTSIYQSINGIRDETGKAVGKLTVTANGDKYAGTGTFVLMKYDAKGRALKSKGTSSAAGSFEVTCNGYAPVATASASPSKPSPTAGQPSKVPSGSSTKPAGSATS
ncbi:MAG: hypothetical protein QOE89_1780 [Pseudonocardiales bacterium]|nr:hypothetical protein [Pseudonocardiales bacterium]